MRLFELRGPVTRMPTWLAVLGLIGVVGWQLLRFAARHLWIVTGLTVIGLVWYAIDRRMWVLLAAVCAVILFCLGGWVELHPGRGWQRVQLAALTLVRHVAYRRRWEDTMWGAQLVRADVMPTLVRVRSETDSDVLTVRMAPGSLLTDWREAAPRVAQGLRVRAVRPRQLPGHPDLLVLRARRTSSGRPPAWSDGRTVETAAVADEEFEETEDAGPGMPPGKGSGAFPRAPQGRTDR